MYGSRISDATTDFWFGMLKKWVQESNLAGPQKDECMESINQVLSDSKHKRGLK